MRKVVLGVLTVVTVLAAGAANAGKEHPALPLEPELAAGRGDRLVLHFYDSSSRIPDWRIKQLLRHGNVLGNKVLLASNVAVYFPDDQIVSAQMELHKYQPREGLVASQVRAAAHLQPDARYDRMVGRFDDVFGPVCATTPDPHGADSHAEMRVKSDGVVTVVFDTPGRFDVFTNESTRSYRMVSVVDTNFIEDVTTTRQLLLQCNRKASAGTKNAG